MWEHFWIDGGRYQLSAMLHSSAATSGTTPLVVCCHGFTGDKVGTNQLMLHLARIITAAGFTTLRFDFAGSGESEGDFAADTTVQGWRDDLRHVLAWVKEQPDLAAAPLYLLGHSLGGLVVLCHQGDDVAGRVALAPVIRPRENFRDIIFGPALWQDAVRGRRIANFAGRGFSLDPGFVRDLQENRHDPLDAVRRYHTPLLIVHGAQDAVVPPADSAALYSAYEGEKERRVIEADHVFTGQHEAVGSLVTAWLTRQVRRRGGNAAG